MYEQRDLFRDPPENPQLPTEIEPSPPASINDGAGSQTKPPANLAEVLAILEKEAKCAPIVKERKSALRQVSVVLRRTLCDLPADPVELSYMLHRAPYAAAGLTKQRWAKIRSLTAASLRTCDIKVMPGRDIAGMSLEWRRLFELLNDKRRKASLSRFMSHCSRAGIGPEAVTAKTFFDFKHALDRTSMVKNPRETYGATVYRWNEAAGLFKGWPQLVVASVPNPRHYSLAWQDFPESFAKDVESFLADAGNQDVLDDNYCKPVRPGTVLLRRRLLRQMASALTASGVEVTEVTGLSVLVEPIHARAILNWQLQRQGGTTASIVQQAWLLSTVAKKWVKKPESTAYVAELAKRLAAKPTGMKPRNRARLRQFDHPANVRALLHLPANLLSRAKKEKIGDQAEARRVMLAVAVEILLVAPMRVGNLNALEHARHLMEFGRGRSWERHIIIPAEETKTAEAFEMILPEETNALLDVYLKIYRPRIAPEDSIYLFPNHTGGKRNTIGLSRAISKLVEVETGIQMHVHLFRHLAGKLYLDANPGDYETPRRFLGHKGMATTMAHYTEQKTDQAFKRLGATIAGHRRKDPSPSRPKLRSK